VGKVVEKKFEPRNPVGATGATSSAEFVLRYHCNVGPGAIAELFELCDAMMASESSSKSVSKHLPDQESAAGSTSTKTKGNNVIDSYSVRAIGLDAVFRRFVQEGELQAAVQKTDYPVEQITQIRLWLEAAGSGLEANGQMAENRPWICVGGTALSGGEQAETAYTHGGYAGVNAAENAGGFTPAVEFPAAGIAPQNPK